MLTNEENVYLVGFMGAGKSTVGKLLAEMLKRPFSDTDVLIERRYGKSIAEIFAESGERMFREIEKAVVAEVATHSSQVVALGGGSVIEDRNRRIIEESGISIYLQWPFRMLCDRILGANTRPLVTQLRTESGLRDLYEQRREYYEKADHVIACDECGAPQNVVATIMRRLQGEA